uniref:ATP synthase subunit a n=1 Tax=Neostromboceros nipponicus TaxID=2805799 RepID=A0A8A6C6L4_9HYME|nr:ATP synthase F0 subunit 6 [Neostromboceros nipponicus]QTH79151.1 ATP synthase F0 subunit 6 [Neostromboceros nipponicus]UQS76349.1 ATP synthase F0 subunit 6 [Neostromboceros nipponicus]
MMMNLFSIFDPTSSIFNISLNWLSTLIMLIFLPQLYWIISSRNNILFFKIMNNIHNELKTLMGKNIKGSTIMYFSLFMFILMNNLFGLFPYIFTSTSHLSLTMMLAFPLWLSFNLFGWLMNMKHMFTHLLPQNTPLLLMPFMVLIETISNLIRSFTLSVRLTANMIAGHLLLTLLSSMGLSLSYYMLLILVMTQFLLLILEFAVAIIQSYVFMVLMSLYSSEVN